mmetsp:Transcript_20491/g.43968  ORF Transcript_20491/g.43968 Transcript_20491/m.43968 type:complete len:134 (-) Transcript_20491:66-467(-)
MGAAFGLDGIRDDTDRDHSRRAPFRYTSRPSARKEAPRHRRKHSVPPPTREGVGRNGRGGRVARERGERGIAERRAPPGSPVRGRRRRRAFEPVVARFPRGCGSTWSTTTKPFRVDDEDGVNDDDLVDDDRVD